jgi:hypothetical protein
MHEEKQNPYTFQFKLGHMYVPNNFSVVLACKNNGSVIFRSRNKVGYQNEYFRFHFEA